VKKVHIEESDRVKVMRFMALLKEGDSLAWSDFQRMFVDAAHGDKDAKETLACIAVCMASYPMPCCSNCADKPVISGCGCRAAVGFCC
jgi:hypothetical protein